MSRLNSFVLIFTQKVGAGGCAPEKKEQSQHGRYTDGAGSQTTEFQWSHRAMLSLQNGERAKESSGENSRGSHLCRSNCLYSRRAAMLRQAGRDITRRNSSSSMRRGGEQQYRNRAAERPHDKNVQAARRKLAGPDASRRRRYSRRLLSGISRRRRRNN